MLFYRSNSDIVNLIMFFFEHFIFGELISLINKDLIEPVLNRVKSMLKQLCDSDDYLDYVQSVTYLFQTHISLQIELYLCD